jgi:predicted nucleotidyltransferase
MLNPVETPNFSIPYPAIASLCQRWNIVELALFGSVLRPDFSPDSDVDMLVRFAPHARRGLLVMAQIRAELVELLGHPVDVGTREGVEQDSNPYRRDEILRHATVIYAA